MDVNVKALVRREKQSEIIDSENANGDDDETDKEPGMTSNRHLFLCSKHNEKCR